MATSRADIASHSPRRGLLAGDAAASVTGRTISQGWRSGRRATPGRTADALKARARLRSGDGGHLLCGRPGTGAEAGRHAAHLPSRQPAQRLDPRGGHHLHGAALHGHLQQPGRSTISKSRSTTPETIVPDLAESWAWDASKTKLTFKLRQGVKWHDGKPFTAKDVQCTWNKLTGKDPDDFRKNPRAIWWHNLKEVTVNGDHEVTFNLNRPQPSFLSLFASGYTAGLPLPRLDQGYAHQSRSAPGPSSSSSSSAASR